jgi:hypothetical protein
MVELATVACCLGVGFVGLAALVLWEVAHGRYIGGGNCE